MLKRLVLLAGLGMFAGAPLLAQQTPPATEKPAQAGKADEAKKPGDKPFDLMVGDKAPPLTVEKWVKGDAVAKFEPGKVYVVEFWATWCGPCVMSMPHLSEMQKLYKDKGVTVIGMTSVDKNNPLDKVEAMVKDKGDGMGYTVAWDKERTTNKAYMEAAGQNGIPTAFVVDQKGTIAFIGHPMELDKPLEEIVAGKWDIKAAAEKQRAAMQAQAVMMKMQAAYMKQDWKEVLRLIDEAGAKDKDIAAQLLPQKFEVLLVRLKDTDKAYALAKEALAGPQKDNAMILNGLAWMIVDPQGAVEKKDLDVALKLSQRACELSKNEDAAILDTLARIYFLKGDLDKAIEVQTKAVGLAPEQLKGDLQESLKEYQDAKAKKK